MKLYIIRHGETDWNKEKRLQGQSDTQLNEYGIELARITGEALKDVHFDYIFSSPLKRAYKTAELIRMAGPPPPPPPRTGSCRWWASSAAPASRR